MMLQNRSRKRILSESLSLQILCATLIGIVAFILLYGIKVLNPSYDSWLLNNNSDLTQHYLGWKFFRKSEWHFPIGLIDGLTAKPISIIYTDSIPIFAIFWKLLSPILPETFQYFGLWGLGCFILQANFCMLLFRKYFRDIIKIIPAIIFCTVSSVVLQRMFGHTALASHWIIFAAFLLWAYSGRLKSVYLSTICWTGLMCLSAGIHMYLMPMVFAIMCASFLEKFLEKKVIFKNVATIIISVSFTLLFMWILGAFYGNSLVTQIGLGEYSFNLNAFFNPQGTSIVLKDLGVVSEGQGEGYNYLGLGVIVMGAIGLCGYIIRNKTIKLTQRRKSIIVLCCILIIIAASPKITLGSHVLLNIPLPDFLFRLLSIFRATGRFAWPVLYILIMSVCILVTKMYKRKISIMILWFCLILQIIDFYPVVKRIRTTFNNNQEYHSSLSSDAWLRIAEDADSLEFMTNFTPKIDNTVLLNSFYPLNKVFELTEYAYENAMTLNDFYIGRRDCEYIETEKYKEWQALLNGKMDKSKLYIFSEIPYLILDKDYIHIYEVDGLIIGTSMNLNIQKISLYEPLDIIHLVQPFLINGNDENGIRTIEKGGVSFGPYIDLPEGNYQVIVEGENLEGLYADVMSEGSTVSHNIMISEFTDTNLKYNVEFTDNASDLEFRLKNEGSNIIRIEKFSLVRTE